MANCLNAQSSSNTAFESLPWNFPSWKQHVKGSRLGKVTLGRKPNQKGEATLLNAPKRDGCSFTHKEAA